MLDYFTVSVLGCLNQWHIAVSDLTIDIRPAREDRFHDVKIAVGCGVGERLVDAIGFLRWVQDDIALRENSVHLFRVPGANRSEQRIFVGCAASRQQVQRGC
jgi:hypothetical protein